MIRLYAALAAVAVLLAALGGLYLKGKADGVAKWKPRAEAAQKLAAGWEKSFRQAEALRADEAKTAREAVDAVQSQCDARVKQARASAKVIREIVNAPVKYDANNCPVRVTIPTDRLRDALQPR
jgi:hypothetical protein